MAKKVYISHYSSRTLEFILTSVAKTDPLDPDNVPLPANATRTLMELEPGEHEAARYVVATDDWEIVSDFRGVSYEKPEGGIVIITELDQDVPNYELGIYSVAAKTAVYGQKLLWLEERYNRHINGTFSFGGKNYNCNHVEIFTMYLTAQQEAQNDSIGTYPGHVKEGMWETAHGFFTAMTNGEFITGLFPAYSANQNRIKTLILSVKRELEDLLEDTSKTTVDLRLSGREIIWGDDTEYPMP